MFRGVSDADGVQGRCDSRRSGGKRVECSDGGILLRAGLHLSSWRLPTGAFSGVFEPSIRRSIRRGGWSCERECKRRSHRCNGRRRARHRQRRPHRHRQYAYPPLGNPFRSYSAGSRGVSDHSFVRGSLIGIRRPSAARAVASPELRPVEHRLRSEQRGRHTNLLARTINFSA